MNRKLALLVSVLLGATAGVAVLSAAPPAQALENGLARKPQMGWNDWNTFYCNVNESLIRQAADTMVSKGTKVTVFF